MKYTHKGFCNGRPAKGGIRAEGGVVRVVCRDGAGREYVDGANLPDTPQGRFQALYILKQMLGLPQK